MKKFTTGKSAHQRRPAKNAEEPTSKSSSKADKIATLTNLVAKPWRRSEIKAMEEHFNRRMSILNAVLVHLEEIRTEVETKRNILTVFMKKVDAAISKALENRRETAYSSNPACKKVDDVLRKLVNYSSKHYFFLPEQMHEGMDEVNKKLVETRSELKELQTELKESHKEQKSHAKEEKRIRELEEGNKEAMEKVEKTATLVKEIEAAIGEARLRHTGTAHPKIEACRLADEYLTRATNGQVISRKVMLEGVETLKGVLESIKSLYSPTKDAHDRSPREWNDAKKGGDIRELQRIQDKLQNQIAQCRESVHIGNLFMSLSSNSK